MKIDWDRARSIFNYQTSPSVVSQKQFDGFHEKLIQLAKTPQEEIDFRELWYYHHDLAYMWLQPDLFAYLFPVCLLDWHESLINNEPCSHGDSEFHYGVKKGDVFSKMLSDQQYTQISEFLVDSFLERLDRERGLSFEGSNASPYGWIGRFNSIALILPVISIIWEKWWSLKSIGRAVCAIQYLSSLVYYETQNPIFATWTPEYGGGSPDLWTHDSYIYHEGWMKENLEFIESTLTIEYLEKKLNEATSKLEGEPEYPKAIKMVEDFPERKKILQVRIEELPCLLLEPDYAKWTF